MIRAFEYLTNLAVRYPLPNPLPRGEGIRLLKIRERRIESQMAGKPENVWARQPDSLSPWERARERAKPFRTSLPDFQKTPFQNGYRQKRLLDMNIRPCSLISKV